MGPWFGERKGDAGSQERLLEREVLPHVQTKGLILWGWANNSAGVRQSCFPLELFLLGPIPCCFPVSKQFSLETERIPTELRPPKTPLGAPPWAPVALVGPALRPVTSNVKPLGRPTGARDVLAKKREKKPPETRSGSLRAATG